MGRWLPLFRLFGRHPAQKDQIVPHGPQGIEGEVGDSKMASHKDHSPSLLQGLIQMMKTLHFDKPFNKRCVHKRDEISHHLSDPSQFKGPFNDPFNYSWFLLFWVRENHLIFVFSPLLLFPVIARKGENPWVEKC